VTGATAESQKRNSSVAASANSNHCLDPGALKG